jgi:hypothetical protein
MIYLSSEIQQAIETSYQGIRIRPDKIIFKHPKMTITIPSKLYPLNNKKTITLFSAFNTEEIENEPVVQEVFNSLDFPPGFCYSNTEKLYQALKEKGIDEIETYVGWVTAGFLPIHHCWLVYKGQHVLDGGIGKTEIKMKQIIQEKNITDMDALREIYSNLVLEESRKPNSETKTFGQVLPHYLYVGTKCTPQEGRDIFNHLINSFPNHPSYLGEGQNPHGASKTQQMIYQKLKKNKKD